MPERNFWKGGFILLLRMWIMLEDYMLYMFYIQQCVHNSKDRTKTRTVIPNIMNNEFLLTLEKPYLQGNLLWDNSYF